MMFYNISREPDDSIADVRISLGRPKGFPDSFYMVFRGEPEKVISLLENALNTAKKDLPEENYKDMRGRPQG